MESNKVRTRYAPSPTGNLHIGGARTALFAYLHAKSKNGEFLLRLEDTDTERNLEYGEKNQMDTLEWLGIIPDYSPINPDETGSFRQSERLEIYEEKVKELLNNGNAYLSWHTPEDLEAELEKQSAAGKENPRITNDFLRYITPKENAKPSVRIKVPDDEIYEWDDGVRGKMSVPSSAIIDWVIQKSNGIPTYNFANVVDDHLMKITDVHRGEEHISNTPKQIQLYKLFGWEIPKFYHLTIIINDDGKKLSKRDESVLQFIHLYKERGYLSEAVFNFLSLLGWSPGGVNLENEIFSHSELINIFDIKRFSKAPSKFDVKKLQWTNNQYIQKLNKNDIYEFLNKFVEEVNLSEEQKAIIFESFQPGIHEGIEIINLIKLFIEEPEAIDEFKDSLRDSKKLLVEIYSKLDDLENWTSEEIKQIINNTGKDMEIKGTQLHFPIRMAITLKAHGPELSKIMEIFGKGKSLERLKIYETL